MTGPGPSRTTNRAPDGIGPYAARLLSLLRTGCYSFRRGVLVRDCTDPSGRRQFADLDQQKRREHDGRARVGA